MLKAKGQKLLKRSLNFKSDEIDRLMNLVIKYRHVILNKKSDNYAVREKDLAWEAITEEYNEGLDARLRDTETLKCKYRNIKSGKLCNTYERYKERMESESGIPLPMKMLDGSSLSAVKEEVESTKEATDDDNDENESVGAINEDPLDVPENFSEDEPLEKRRQIEANDVNSQPRIIASTPSSFRQSETSRMHGFSSFQPTRPTPQPTRIRIHKSYAKRQGPTDKWQELAQEKIIIAQEKRIQQNEQHKLLLKTIQAEHSLKMQLMKEEFELKKKKLELEILTLSQKI